MMSRITLVVSMILVTAGMSASVASAQSTVTVSYAPGWNMVGAPAGTVLPGASSVDAYTANGYVSLPGATTSGCQGYWAYFATSTSIALPIATGSTQTCSLQSGWNLLGDPFSDAVALPAGLSGFHWNPATGAYDVVTSISPGMAIWLYSATASSVVVTDVNAPAPTANATATSAATPPTVEIDGLPNGGSYTLHVGDTIKLVLPLNIMYQATADPAFLHLDSAGESGDLSCLGTASCAINIANQFWTWSALKAGTTYIVVTPACRFAKPACELASTAIDVTIQP